jgi:hypothetical protein
MGLSDERPDPRTEDPKMCDQTTETETVTCDGCEAEISVDLYDANDGLCPVCLAETFVCEDCAGRCHQSDAHPALKTYCEACGDSKLEAEAEEWLDALKDEARDLLEAIVESEDLDAITKAVKALKRLQAKS